MQHDSKRTPKTIRINDNVYYKARVAAVMSRKSLGQWLEGIILEKVDGGSQVSSGEPDGKVAGAG